MDAAGSRRPDAREHQQLDDDHGSGGLNVISSARSTSFKQTLTISGSASDIFIFNVTGAYIFNGSQMVLSGG